MSQPKTINFDAFVLNGSLDEMKAKLKDDIFVLDKLAILGQFTLFYGKPSVGKTHITLLMLIQKIKNKELNPKDVYYVNADDNYRGIITKLEIAEYFGFGLISPGFNDFSPPKFSDYINSLIKEDKANGKIIILDTVKKFTDLMSKQQSSQFAQTARSFVSVGGTIIGLAHVNKNRDANGKPIYAGTSDLVDDSDAVYVIDTADTSLSLGRRTSIFENIKARGDNLPSAAFSFTDEKGIPYHDILASIKPISKEEELKATLTAKMNHTLAKNANVIEAIIEAINCGKNTTQDIIEYASKNTGEATRKVSSILTTHTGQKFHEGHRWNYTRKEKNLKEFKLLFQTMQQQ
jgi:hypothetical protein